MSENVVVCLVVGASTILIHLSIVVALVVGYWLKKTNESHHARPCQSLPPLNPGDGGWTTTETTTKPKA
jgi:hypothetical protein